jgi:hypothetical protein
MQVSILGMMSLLLILGGCDSSSGATQRPTMPPIIPTVTTVLPDGWYTVSTPSALGFTDGSGSVGLAVSPANPPEIAGCGMPAMSLNEKAVPKFLYSADAGHTWHVNVIQGASATNSCSIVADSILPQTFVIQLGGNGSPQLLVTRDNGVTWKSLASPSGYAPLLSEIPGFGASYLVDGHLITAFLPVGQTSPFHLYDLRLSGGFTALDTHMPQPPKIAGLVGAQPPEAFAVDPTNPGHLYVAVYGAFGPNHNSGFRLYETRNAGVSWQDIHEWQTSLRLAIWTSSDKRVYALDLQDTQTGLYSTADDATWQFTNVNAGSLALSPSGLVVLIGDQNLTSFDASRRLLQPISAQQPHVLFGTTFWVVIDRPSPAFLLVTNQGTFVRPFTPAH